MPVSQLSLKDLTLKSESRSFDAAYIFPFFNPAFKVLFHMMLTKSNELIFFYCTSLSKIGRTITLTQSAILKENSLVANNLFGAKYHLDPYWLLKTRKLSDESLEKKIKATNLAGANVGKLQIVDILFNDPLTKVDHIKVKDGFLEKMLTIHEVQSKGIAFTR